MKKLLAIFMILMLYCMSLSGVSAADNRSGLKKVFVEISYNDSSDRDVVGLTLFYHLYDEIKKLDGVEVSNTNVPRMQVIFSSVNPQQITAEAAGMLTIYSVVWNIVIPKDTPFYCDTTVGICGKNALKVLAADLAHETNNYANKLIRELND